MNLFFFAKNFLLYCCYYDYQFHSKTLQQILHWRYCFMVVDKVHCCYCNSYVNPIQDGLFRGCSRMGRAFLAPLPKIPHTYPTMMKLGTVIPYLRKIQKMYKSRDTSLEFCWHQHFFTGNQEILLHQEIHIDWILIHNF